MIWCEIWTIETKGIQAKLVAIEGGFLTESSGTDGVWRSSGVWEHAGSSSTLSSLLLEHPLVVTR